MIVIILCLQLTLLLVYFYTFEVYFLLTSVGFLWYLTSYRDGNEYTGNRVWPWLRGFGPYIKYIWANVNEATGRGKHIYIISGNVTYLSMICGFGLCGKKYFTKTCYMLPHGVFYVPLLRDVLLWTGAVSERSDIIELLDKGWSVCTTEQQHEDIFQYAYARSIHVVPACVTGEEQCFHVWKGPEQITSWSYKHFGWPFPFIIIPKFRENRQRHWKLEIGIEIDPRDHCDASSFTHAAVAMMKLDGIIVHVDNDE